MVGDKEEAASLVGLVSLTSLVELVMSTCSTMMEVDDCEIIAVIKAPPEAATFGDVLKCITGYIKGRVKSEDENARDALTKELELMANTDYVSGEELLAALSELRRKYESLADDLNCQVYKKLAVQLKSFHAMAKNELESAKICLDCVVEYYAHGGEQEEASWFTAVCSNPHTIVWAHQLPYKPYPAKVLQVMGDNVQVRFFGKPHQTAILPRAMCYSFTKTYLWGKAIGKYKVACDEVELHCTRLNEVYNGSKIIYAVEETPQPYKGNLYLEDVQMVTRSQRVADLSSAANLGLDVDSPGCSKDTNMANRPVDGDPESGMSSNSAGNSSTTDVLANDVKLNEAVQSEETEHDSGNGSIKSGADKSGTKSNCSVCGRAIHKRSLNRHEKNHRLFECSRCEKYIYDIEFKRHYLNEHEMLVDLPPRR